jgi:intraflagellar transport protein 80
LVEITNGLMIYNYEGRLISNPKVQGTKCIVYNLIILVEYLSRKKISISNDILAIIDGNNSKLIKFYDMSNGK